MSHFCYKPYRRIRFYTNVRLLLRWLNQFRNMSTNETEAPEEVLNGLLVKEVVVDAVLSLVHQPSLFGDEVPDGESVDEALAGH